MCWQPSRVGFTPLRGIPGFAHACAARAAVANLAAGLALEWSRHRIRTVCLALGSILMGFGISLMHYTGMGALELLPAINYDIPIFIASVVVAIVVSAVALVITFKLRREASVGSCR